jgi:hypothetical protein
MRNIVLNRNNIKENRRNLGKYLVKEIESPDLSFRRFIITFDEYHGMVSGDDVVMILERPSEDGYFTEDGTDETKKSGYIPALHTTKVVKIDNKKIQIDIPQYVYVTVENYGLPHLVEKIETNPTNGVQEIIKYYNGYDILLDIQGDYVYNFIRNHKDIKILHGGKEIPCFINVNNDNSEDLAAQIITSYGDNNISFTGLGSVGIYNDWYLVDDENFLGVTYFNENIIFEDRESSVTVSLGLNKTSSYQLDDEQQALLSYLEDVQNTIIPETVDNEKKQFSPVINGKYATEIIFNLHFRDRKDLDKNDGSLNEGWRTTDMQYWNKIGVNDDGLVYLINNSDGDELSDLGFTEDDIKYRKTKLKKSFIRLLFYSSREMLSRDLLCYSTIFFDTGDMFQKYIKIKGQGLTCFDKQRTDNNLRISSSFRVSNKYDSRKCSEGFYLYLFPNEIGGENNETTIYMKVEFNHAGYGKTIPMMLPTKKNYDNTYELINIGPNFPIDFNGGSVTEGIYTDFERYQECVMIPVTIKKDNILNDYVYEFPFIKGKTITLNLFEPRVKGFVDETKVKSIENTETEE